MCRKVMDPAVGGRRPPVSRTLLFLSVMSQWGPRLSPPRWSWSCPEPRPNPDRTYSQDGGTDSPSAAVWAAACWWRVSDVSSQEPLRWSWMTRISSPGCTWVGYRAARAPSPAVASACPLSPLFVARAGFLSRSRGSLSGWGSRSPCSSPGSGH